MGAVPGSTADEPVLIPPGIPGLASTRSPTYAHRQRRRSAGALHPEGARSPGTSSTSSMGAVPGSTADEPVLIPPGIPGLASTRSPTYAHRQRRRSAGALHPEGARSPGTSSTSSMGAVPGSTADEPVLIPPGIPRVGEHPLADVCAQTTQA